jgi:hypothetical protein
MLKMSYNDKTALKNELVEARNFTSGTLKIIYSYLQKDEDGNWDSEWAREQILLRIEDALNQLDLDGDRFFKCE